VKPEYLRVAGLPPLAPALQPFKLIHGSVQLAVQHGLVAQNPRDSLRVEDFRAHDQGTQLRVAPHDQAVLSLALNPGQVFPKSLLGFCARQ
jgi:hypothetical protein